MFSDCYMYNILFFQDVTLYITVYVFKILHVYQSMFQDVTNIILCLLEVTSLIIYVL